MKHCSTQLSVVQPIEGCQEYSAVLGNMIIVTPTLLPVRTSVAVHGRRTSVNVYYRLVRSEAVMVVTVTVIVL